MEAYRTQSVPIWICFLFNGVSFGIQAYSLWAIYRERNHKCKLSG
jgi:hypothetical protein